MLGSACSLYFKLRAVDAVESLVCEVGTEGTRGLDYRGIMEFIFMADERRQ